VTSAAPAPLTTFAYNPGIDGLRAIAIAAVVMYHGRYWLDGGDHGVTVFFVISGYLISSLLIAELRRTGGITLRVFYWRRLVRLGPALLVVIAATVIWLGVTRVPIDQWWAGLVGALTYTTDIIAAFFGNAAVSENFEFTWTLGIEEQFYLLWPLLLVLLLRVNYAPLTFGIIAAGIGSAWAVRLWLIITGAAPAALSFGPFSHVDALLLGCLIAIVFDRWPDSRAPLVVARVVGPIGAVVLGLVFASFPFAPGVDRIGVSALASAAVVLWVAVAPRDLLGRLLALPPIVFVGRLSYGMYLWNLLLLWIFVDLVGVRPGLTPWGPIWLAAVVIVAGASYYLIERPMRRRLAPRSVPVEKETQVPA
jgi:peptidoglycan/LPS O-acetylase OafA/YrhL